MNILFLAKRMDFATGGVSTHVIELSKIFKKYMHNVFVASAGGEYVKELNKIDVPHYFIPFQNVEKNPLISLSIVRELTHIIRNNRIDIIHCHWRVTALFAQILYKLYGIPFVWTNHLEGIPNKGIYRYLFFYDKKAIAVSTDLKEELINRFNIPEEKIEVVYNGIDLNNYSPLTTQEMEEIKNKLKIPEGSIVMSIIARLSEHKGQKDILVAMRELVDKYPNLFLLIAGEGSSNYKNELIELAKNYNVLNNVIFTGYQNPRNVLGVSDIFLLPSYKEGLSIACLEAMAMGVPVIRSRTGGWTDMKDACIIVEPGDVNSLVDSIERLINDKKLFCELQKKGKELVNRNFTVDVMYEKLFKIYSEVSGKRSEKNNRIA